MTRLGTIVAAAAGLAVVLVLTQPAHLQRAHGGPLTPAERNVVRADVVRERLAASESHGRRRRGQGSS